MEIALCVRTVPKKYSSISNNDELHSFSSRLIFSGIDPRRPELIQRRQVQALPLAQIFFC